MKLWPSSKAAGQWPPMAKGRVSEKGSEQESVSYSPRARNNNETLPRCSYLGSTWLPLIGPSCKRQVTVLLDKGPACNTLFIWLLFDQFVNLVFVLFSILGRGGKCLLHGRHQYSVLPLGSQRAITLMLFSE